MKRLLFISGFAVSPHSTSSGQKLAFKRLIQFASSYDEIFALQIVNQIDSLDFKDHDIKLPPNVRLTTIVLKRWHRISGLLLFPWLPCFASARRRAAGDVVAQLIEGRKFSNFFADFSQGLACVPSKHINKFAFRQHDVVSRLYERMIANSSGILRAFLLIELWRCSLWERHVWLSVKEISVLNRDDVKKINAWNPVVSITVEKTRDLITIPRSPVKRAIVPGRIIFWGNMSRFENIDAVLWFAAEIFPVVLQSVPSAHFVIIGAHPTADVVRLSNDVIRVTGFLEDPAEEFSSAAVAVAPLRLGSGVKIKVLETIDRGIKTITTNVGAEGIPASELLVVTDDAMGIAKEIVAVLNEAGQKATRAIAANASDC